jgi:hypothetical protein
MLQIKKALTTSILFLAGISCYCQNAATPIRNLDSLNGQSADTGGNVKNDRVLTSTESCELNVSTYFILLGSNLKEAFAKPFHMKGKDWAYAGMAVVFVGGLSFDDEPVQQAALKLRNESPALCRASKTMTGFGGSYELYTLSALGAYSFLFKKEKMKTTTLLGTQAYVTGAAVENVLKLITVRRRPSSYSPLVEAEPSFEGPFINRADNLSSRSHSSFPSGHTTSAFAVATVFATVYENRPWVPVLAYGTATLVGLSRITENRHWATDVAVGAALGYLTGRQAVTSFHKYQTSKAMQKTAKLSFNLQYNFGHLMPGVVYAL